MTKLRFVLIPKKEIGKEEFYGAAEGAVRIFYEKKRGYDKVIQSRTCTFSPWSRNPKEIEENKKLKKVLKDRHGLPDFFALKDGNPPRFIEVKGKGDSFAFRKSQVDWMIRHISEFSVDVVLTRKPIDEVREVSFTLNDLELGDENA